MKQLDYKSYYDLKKQITSLRSQSITIDQLQQIQQTIQQLKDSIK